GSGGSDPGKANVVADALSRKSGMIAGISRGGNYSRFGAVEFHLDDDNVLWQDTRSRLSTSGLAVCCSS
nr:hypothetical protein [Tanacetum cinerariifolium]